MLKPREAIQEQKSRPCQQARNCEKFEVLTESKRQENKLLMADFHEKGSQKSDLGKDELDKFEAEAQAQRNSTSSARSGKFKTSLTLFLLLNVRRESINLSLT